jgi:predicted nucleic acid-binding protein
MTPSSNAGAVVIDANVVIAICAHEQDKFDTAEAAIADYTTRGWLFYAPGVIVSESLFVLCFKQQNGLLTPATYLKAVENFRDQMRGILPPPTGEASLIVRAAEIQSGYSCRHSADGIYIALAEELSQSGATELLTFDADLPKQAARNAPTVKVNLLPC